MEILKGGIAEHSLIKAEVQGDKILFQVIPGTAKE
jgi:hypothetical protein